MVGGVATHGLRTSAQWLRGAHHPLHLTPPAPHRLSLQDPHLHGPAVVQVAFSLQGTHEHAPPCFSLAVSYELSHGSLSPVQSPVSLLQPYHTPSVTALDTCSTVRTSPSRDQTVPTVHWCLMMARTHVTELSCPHYGKKLPLSPGRQEAPWNGSGVCFLPKDQSKLATPFFCFVQFCYVLPLLFSAFDTRTYSVAMAELGLAVQTRLVSDLHKYCCPCLQVCVSQSGLCPSSSCGCV